MQNVIIITGHGQYASGVKSSLEMIAGPNTNIYAVDFFGNDSNDTVRKKYETLIAENRGKGIIFFCDLLGGTPFKEASLLAFNRSDIEVVVGCNIGSLLDATMKLENLATSDLAKEIIENSIKNIVRLDKKMHIEEGGHNGEGI